MLREKLKLRNGKRMRFKGTFDRYGLKVAYKGLPLETICLTDIQDLQGEEVTDHLWFNHTKGFRELGVLYPGDRIAFDARVGAYLKGYAGREEEEEGGSQQVDYKLTRPTKLMLLSKVGRRKIYIICEKCDHVNRITAERCRRCKIPFEEQPPKPVPQQPPDPKLIQRTLEEEFTSIMDSIGVKVK